MNTLGLLQEFVVNASPSKLSRPCIGVKKMSLLQPLNETTHSTHNSPRQNANIPISSNPNSPVTSKTPNYRNFYENSPQLVPSLLILLNLVSATLHRHNIFICTSHTQTPSPHEQPYCFQPHAHGPIEGHEQIVTKRCVTLMVIRISLWPKPRVVQQ